MRFFLAIVLACATALCAVSHVNCAQIISSNSLLDRISPFRQLVGSSSFDNTRLSLVSAPSRVIQGVSNIVTAPWKSNDFSSRFGRIPRLSNLFRGTSRHPQSETLGYNPGTHDAPIEYARLPGSGSALTSSSSISSSSASRASAESPNASVSAQGSDNGSDNPAINLPADFFEPLEIVPVASFSSFAGNSGSGGASLNSAGSSQVSAIGSTSNANNQAKIPSSAINSATVTQTNPSNANKVSASTSTTGLAMTLPSASSQNINDIVNSVKLPSIGSKDSNSIGISSAVTANSNEAIDPAILAAFSNIGISSSSPSGASGIISGQTYANSASAQSAAQTTTATSMSKPDIQTSELAGQILNLDSDSLSNPLTSTYLSNLLTMYG